MTLLKKHLIDQVAEATGETKAHIRDIVDSIGLIIHRAIGNGEDAFLVGVGKLEIRHRGERKARDMKTGEPCVVPAHNTVYLKPSESVVKAANAKV